MSYILGADHTMLACLLHRLATEPGEGRAGKAAAQAGDDLGAVVVARGLAGREEDPRIALSSDGPSLMPGVLPSPVLFS